MSNMCIMYGATFQYVKNEILSRQVESKCLRDWIISMSKTYLAFFFNFVRNCQNR